MKMNATTLITTLIMAVACTSANANDAKHDDHGAGHEPATKSAAPAKPAEPKPAAEAKPAAETKPAEDVKVAADASAEAPAKPVPKKKKAKKAAKKQLAKPAEDKAVDAAHADAGHAAPDAHGGKASDSHAAPAVVAEPSKRLKLKKAYPGGIPVATDAQTAAGHDAPAPAAALDDHAAATAAAPAAPAPAAPSAAAPAASAPAHDVPAAAATPAAPAVDAHAAHASPAVVEMTKRLKPKASLPAAPSAAAPAVVESHAAKAEHYAPAAKAEHHAPAANEHHATPVAAHSDHAHPAETHAATTVAAKVLPAHSGHAPISVRAARAAAEECDLPLKSEVAALFDRWNNSLRTGDPRKVVANYAPNSILLPTVSNRARFTIAEKEDYFTHFLMRRPEGSIDDRLIEVDCNSATDAGLYTFRFADGSKVKARYSFSYKKIGSDWLITSHHSSAMPERAEAGVEIHAGHAPAAKAAPARVNESSEPSTKGWVRYP